MGFHGSCGGFGHGEGDPYPAQPNLRAIRTKKDLISPDMARLSKIREKNDLI